MTNLLDKEITKESYQRTALQFTRNVADLAPVNSIEKFIKLLPAKAKIVDIGCGSGRDAKIFTSFGIEVLGIDFCSNLLEIAKHNAPSAKFQLMDIEKLNLPSSYFDGVWSVCSLAHIPKKEVIAVLKQIHSILKEGGYFYLVLKKGLGESLERDTRYEGDIKKFWAYYEEEELTTALQTAQFKLIELETMIKNDPYQTGNALRAICQK